MAVIWKQEVLINLIRYIRSEITLLELQPHLAGTNWLSDWYVVNTLPYIPYDFK